MRVFAGLGLAFGASSVRAQPALRTDVTEKGLFGRFYARPDARSRPAILMLNGSDGGFPSEAAARDLADAGWPTLALAYFRDYNGVPEGAPEGLTDIPLEYFVHALSWMKRRPEVQGRSLVLMGQSRGGELALLLGSLRPDIAGVVAYSPSDRVWQGIPRYGAPPAAPRAAWTRNGAPLPFQVSVFSPGTPMRSWFEQAVPIDAAIIRVEDIRGPILLISSAADTIWPSTTYADNIEARRARAAPRRPVTNLKFEDASHLLMGFGPGITEMKIPGANFTFNFGGSPAGTETARNDGWAAVKSFMAQFG